MERNKTWFWERGLRLLLALMMVLSLFPAMGLNARAESTLPTPSIEVSDITETGATITMTRGDYDAHMYFVFYDVREKSADPITEISFATVANGEVKNASTDDFGNGKVKYVTVTESALQADTEYVVYASVAYLPAGASDFTDMQFTGVATAEFKTVVTDPILPKPTALEPGTYITTLFRQISCTNDTVPIYQTTTEHFSAPAILTVNDDNSSSVTIGVEHWSLYEAFIPAKQAFNDTGFTALPAAVFNSENAFTNYSAFIDENADAVSETANAWYNYTDNSNSKFGDIEIDYNETLDIAYVTFDLADYTKFFAVQGWFNAPIDGNAWSSPASGKQYNDLMVFHVDYEYASALDLNTDVESWYHVVRNTTNQRLQVNDGIRNFFTRNMTLTTMGDGNHYRNTIDDAVITANSDGSISVSYHLRHMNFPYIFCKTVQTAGIRYDESEPWQNWDYWKAASLCDLELDENDYFTIKDRSLK